MMLWLSLIFFFIVNVSTERALPDYTKDAGMAPSWLLTTDHEKAIVDRWYVDKTDATCKPFKYLGSLGNFNNFVSRAACLNHLKFSQEEKANACKEVHSPGSCDLRGKNAFERWYFKKDAVGGKTNSCHKFEYSGCGGNANNFESEEECNNVCRNKGNGGITDNVAADKLTAVPNEFDCTFVPEVKTQSPIMGIVPHKDGNRCVYAAIGADALRGFFKDLPMCVKTCIKNKAPACSLEVPYQTPSTSDVTSDAKVFYYFKQSESVCLPFMSKEPEGTAKPDDGKLNIFSSPELCASFCPATGNTGKLQAVQPCTEGVVGRKTQTDKYKLTRYYYNPSPATGQQKCQAFEFNGKEMNLNNFVSKEACDKICTEPLTTG